MSWLLLCHYLWSSITVGSEHWLLDVIGLNEPSFDVGFENATETDDKSVLDNPVRRCRFELDAFHCVYLVKFHNLVSQ